MSIIPEIFIHGNNGFSMPVLGFGMAMPGSMFGKVDEAANEAAKLAVLQAIEVGYRHFDTSSLYRTEEPLGEAIVEALSLGLIKSRDELFITSKIWSTDTHQGLVLPALRRSLRNLKLEYLNLYLIHWPLAMRPGVVDPEFPIKPEDVVLMDYKTVWSEMEECHRIGLTKAIGVSNFSCKKLGEILSFATIPPAVNQVEVNPLWQQKTLIKYCKENRVTVIAFSPLGARGTTWGTDNVMECKTLHEIAASKGTSVAQICLRWVYEQGFIQFMVHAIEGEIRNTTSNV
uniref:NADP-dependent oxidoreductase domain-containing protein n=1 Tax=Kalanchoe fedtschenkoi TaxID=63787 RepID=A0A7N0U1J7_KALFE